MSQTKKGSLLEAITNTGIGFLISFLVSFLIFPLCGVYIETEQNFIIVTLFTITSILRSYIVRRFYNIFDDTVKMKIRNGYKIGGIVKTTDNTFRVVFRVGYIHWLKVMQNGKQKEN